MHSPRHRTTSQITILLILLSTFALKKIQAQFDIEDSNSTASLRGIHNVGGGVAWASGTNGTVLRTEDGGYLWQTCTIPPGAEKLDFRGIQAFDENTAIVMSSGKGDLSHLYKTTDGCQTWHLLFTNPDKEGFWDVIQFRDRRNGMLLGDPVDGYFSIFETQDGGLHWNRQKNIGAGVALGGGIFAASNSSLIQFDGAQVFGTGGPQGAFAYYRGLKSEECPPEVKNRNDCKFMWTSVLMPPGIKWPVSSRVDSTGVFSLAIRPGRSIEASVIVAVGGDYRKPDKQSDAATVSVNGGQIWTAAQTPPHGYRSSVAYDPQQKLWITVGPNGTDISRDDGKNWTPLKPSGYDPPDADKNWNALSLPFVVGPHGRIGRLRTIDPTPNHPNKN
jgi:hypothetical protein